MPRAANAYSKSGPAIGEATDPIEQQTVRRIQAGTKPAPATTAHASIFAVAQAAKPPQRTKTYLDPLTVPIKTGVPVPQEGRGSRSAYAVLWGRMAPGAMVELPAKQAGAMVALLKKRGLNRQHYAMRKLPGRTDGMCGVWRVA